MAGTELPPAWSIRRWLLTTNHKDVGILYLVTSLFFLLFGGLLAMLMRAQLMFPENNFLSASTYNQAVSVHGLIMVLFFLSPFAFAFANYIVPLQIGARDLAFPRLNAMSYWFYLFGGLLLMISFFQGSAPDLGWTLYAPLNTRKFTPYLGVDTGGMGLILLVISVTMSTINFLITIFRSRAPGLRLMYMPMFTWSILVTVFMMLYAFPSLLAGLLLLAADRLLGTVYFASAEGGALLWDHIFWFFGHPEVYIVLFPAIGAITDIIPTFTRRPLFGRKYIILAMIVAGVISFAVWGHHMFVTGISADIRKAFAVTTIAISLPFDAMFISMIYSLSKAKIRLFAPMLFALGSIAVFIVGGITGIFLGSVALDYFLRGGYWVVAHFHYTMVGGGVLGLIAALYYWYPKMTGKMYHEGLARLHFITAMIGFNLLYFPLFFVYEMPRRVVVYPAETGWGPWNLLATIGGVIFGLSFLIMFWNLLYSARNGREAGPNPWRASTLEWATKSPPPPQNFDGTPTFDSGGLKFVTTNGAPHHHEAETHTSPWPAMLAFSSFLFFLSLTTHMALTVVSVALVAFSIGGLIKERFVAREESMGERWPFEGVERVKLGFWTFLGSEIIFFGILISAYLFVRLNSSTWPAPGSILSIEQGAINTFILLTSSFTAVLALAAAKSGKRGGLVGGLLATLGLGLWFLFNKYVEWVELIDHGFTVSSGLPATTYFFTTGVHGAHVAAGLVALAYFIARAAKGAYTRGDHTSIEYFGLYWHFVDIVWVFLFPLFYLI